MKVDKCRFCNSTNLTKYLDLGDIPLANNLEDTKEKALAAEKFPLAVNWCEDCTMSQLTYAVPPEKLFKNYYYRSGMSQTFKKHCQDLVKLVNPKKNQLWIDIASNDGTLLSYVPCKRLGVEPATNLCHIAESNGIECFNDFLKYKNSSDIVEKYGRADVITAQNVFAHVEDIKDFLLAVTNLIADEGVFIVEAPWAGDFIINNEFDTVYHEHYSYITVRGMQLFCQDYGLRLEKIQYFKSIHGGTIRYFIRPSEKYNDISNQWEIQNAIFRESFLKDRIPWLQDNVNRILYQLKTGLSSYKIGEFCGVGQAAKATIACNYFELTDNDLHCIYDTTPEKIGKFQPGTGIPIRDFKEISKDKPENIIIFPWNFEEEICKNIRKLNNPFSYATLVPTLNWKDYA